MFWEYEKPSRQKRREKRGWKRPRKNGLDHGGIRWQALFPVLNTPLSAVAAPVSLRGFFAPIVFSMAGSAQSYNTLRGKAASGLIAVLKCPPPIFLMGGLLNKLSGGHHGC